MAGKIITQFAIVADTAVTHVVTVANPGPSVEGDALLVPIASLKGAKGDKGDTGSQGAAGAAGTNGAPGTNGTNGTNGAQGPAGAEGPQGEPGVPGPSVIPDEYGAFDEAKVTAIVTAGVDYIYLIVADGDDRVNKTVPAALNGDKSGHLVMYDVTAGSVWRDFGPIVGIQGPAGATGAAGTPGVDGADGTDGTDGSNGADGAQGPQGVKGDKGDKGDTGDVGPQGIQGNTGSTGAPGSPGTTGSTGAKGDTGDPGIITDGITAIVSITQSAYDALDPKSATTLYFING